MKRFSLFTFLIVLFPFVARGQIEVEPGEVFTISLADAFPGGTFPGAPLDFQGATCGFGPGAPTIVTVPDPLVFPVTGSELIQITVPATAQEGDTFVCRLRKLETEFFINWIQEFIVRESEDPELPVLDPRCPSCDHTRSRLDRAGPGETFTDKLGNSTFIADERELRARTNWNYLDLGTSETSSTEVVDLAYYRGRDMAISHNGLWGLMGGVEAGQFDYVAGEEATKIGLAFGAYAARALGNAGVLDTSLTAAYFQNELNDAAGNSADVGSWRIQWNGGVSGTFGRDESWQFKPALDIALTQEMFDAFTLGGSAIAAQTVEGGDASLSLDFLSPIRGTGRFTFGVAAHQALGTDFASVGDVTADLSLGWQSEAMDKTIRKVELTASDLLSDVTDYRLSGFWESAF